MSNEFRINIPMQEPAYKNYTNKDINKNVLQAHFLNLILFRNVIQAFCYEPDDSTL
jgi:hypothetical protein